ncbi:alpha-tocopherol transfer protein-like isoform X2 [Rhynchophorus ferrugineus]|uniref:alpha-tocopherol transfer protein-like isoform X2 n=1 Tax=Rhynchophorus ferrugineus TaxID=354439 RepID=UPI003FCE7AD1
MGSEKDLNVIKEWLKKQLYLPQNIDDNLLRRFLHTCNNSIEQTKTLIDLFYTIRAQIPEIFSNRDPASMELKEIFDNFDFIPMPKLTKNNEKIFVYHIKYPDPDKYHFINALKVFFIFADVRMLVEKDIPDGEIPIFDMANFTLKHLSKINLSVLKKYMVYTQEAHPIKLKGIHLLNVPHFLDRCMQIVKPFMKTEVGKMFSDKHSSASVQHNFQSYSQRSTTEGIWRRCR